MRGSCIYELGRRAPRTETRPAARVAQVSCTAPYVLVQESETTARLPLQYVFVAELCAYIEEGRLAERARLKAHAEASTSSKPETSERAVLMKRPAGGSRAPQ